MSGGSLNYLYCKSDVDGVINAISDMEYAEEELIKRGYTDVAADIRRLIEYCLTARVRIMVLFENLEDVFKAIEWRLSADTGEDDLIKTIERYRSK